MGAESKRAFSELAEAYWYPLYAFLRRKGADVEDAEDTIQSFFGWLIENDILMRAEPERGRLRTFLITALLRYRAREARAENAAKRKPSTNLLSIDQGQGDQRYLHEPEHQLTPENLYERAWAITVIERAMKRLSEEAHQAGNGELFSSLEGTLTGNKTIRGRELAAELNMSEGAVRAAAYRLRRRYGQLLREEVAQTVGSESDLREELIELLGALRVEG